MDENNKGGSQVPEQNYQGMNPYDNMNLTGGQYYGQNMGYGGALGGYAPNMPNGPNGPNGSNVPGGMSSAGVPSGPGGMSGGVGGVPVKSTREMYEELKKKRKGDTFTGMIVLLVMSLVALTFIGLFAWAFVMWKTASGNLEGQIKEQVAKAVQINTEKMNQEFAEREKNPARRFSGPADYGELSFEFPKTWNVYVPKDASKGGDFEAYFSPGVVYEIKDNSIYAMRLNIVNRTLDKVTSDYESQVKNKKLVAKMRVVGGRNTAIYEGVLKDGINVRIAIFGIRDKTVIMRTDAMKQYGKDFDKILSTVTYNK